MVNQYKEMLHIVIDLDDNTYSVCDSVTKIENVSLHKKDNLQRVLSREKKNYIKGNKMVLRVVEKNKVHKIKGGLVLVS